MKITSTKKFIAIFLCVLLITPVFGGITQGEEPNKLIPVKINSDATRPADQINPAIDGDKIVWQDNRNGKWNIYMKDLATGQESQVSASAATQQYPAISGNKIVWSQHKEGTYGYTSNIYMKDLSSGQVKELSKSASSQQYPAISGNKVVWQDDRNRNDDIYFYDITTKTETKITSSLDHQRYPAISGNRIVWADWMNSSIDVYMYDIPTSNKKRISLNVADQNYPAISDNKIVWQDSRNGSSIYLYDLATSTEKRISTYTQQYNSSISGNVIVWEDGRNGNVDIYMYDIFSGVERQLTTDSGDQLSPAISGNRIVWQDNRNGNWDIYMYDIATGIETQVNSNISYISADQTNSAIDGNRVVWQDNRDGHPHIYLKDLATGIERRLSESAATQQYPAISGDKVVWQDSRDGGSIYLYDLSTLSERRINGATRQYRPPINPDIDGNKVVWEDYRDDGRFSDVYMYDLSTSTEKRESAATQQYGRWNYNYYSNPAISENKIVWQSYGRWDWSYVSGISLYDLTNNKETSVIWDFGFEKYRNPVISGNIVVWEDYRNIGYYWYGNPDIYMYDISTKTETRLTTNEYLQTNPAVSGDKIVWADKRGEWYLSFNYGIFLYDISTGIDTRLTESQSPQENPDISGDKIVWQDYRNGNWDIYMIDLNQAPTANAGENQIVNENTSVNLSGTGTDPDGDTLSYNWTQTAGSPTVTLNNPNLATPSFTAPQVTTDTILTFKLTVDDKKGGTNSDEVIITVKNVNKFPAANAGVDQTVNENTTVNLDGTGSSDPDGNTLSYNWKQTAGTPAVTLNSPNSATPSFTAPEVTTDTILTFQLTVNDGKDGTATDTVDITVKNVATTSGGGDSGGGGSPALSIQSTSTGKIKGRIINTSGLAVLGTPARIGNTKVATNLNGEFEFSGLSDGIYTVYYEVPGYNTQTQVLQVLNGGTTIAPTVIMSPALPTGKIRGRIINASGIPILGMPVTVNGIRAATNLNGEFEFNFVADGVYTLFYDPVGYISRTQVLVVSNGGITNGPTVIMSPSGSSSVSTSSVKGKKVKR
ncbi:MAG: PD40 domain-containing protein, partial [Actinobacteria bacterium]|nr:PD40 domain-containing protein [Actinomycetota bacterium]